MFPIVNVTLMLSYILNNNDAFFIPGQQTETMVKIIPSLFGILRIAYLAGKAKLSIALSFVCPIVD